MNEIVRIHKDEIIEVVPIVKSKNFLEKLVNDFNGWVDKAPLREQRRIERTKMQVAQLKAEQELLKVKSENEKIKSEIKKSESERMNNSFNFLGGK